MSQSKDNVAIDRSPVPSNEAREAAEVERMPDGEVLGVPVYLTASDLRNLGYIPDSIDAVVIRVLDGAVLVEPVR